jgi:hypothetical protein
MVNTDTHSLTNSKTNQLIKNVFNQLHTKHIKNVDINNQFIIYHQNIGGLKGKINEFLLSLPTAAQLICFTEHHLKDYKLANTYIPNYTLGANYCRKNLKQGGLCIYVHEFFFFSNINPLKYSNEQDIEIAATQLNIHRRKVIIICIYSAPPWMWVPVTTAWRVLRLRMEEGPPKWRVAVNKLNKQPRKADEGWSSSLGVGRGANNPSP